MIEANVSAIVSLAREMAEIIPSPPGGPHPDPVSYRAWEELMLTAATGLADTACHDEQVLASAVGPKLEVGVNPPWRVLLQIAQLEAEARNDRRHEVGASAARALIVEQVSARAFG